MAARPVRVLVVDDSASIRALVSDLLSQQPGICVVGTAADPFIARDKIKHLAPDVLTLDVEMPRMDGLTFLRNLMRLRPMPVVMLSTLTHAGAQVTLDALALGAVDFMPKPRHDANLGLDEYAQILASKLRDAARARVMASAEPRLVADTATCGGQACLLAIGASAGGTVAIRHLLAAMPAQAPPIVIAQHIPAAFSTAFAERLDRHSRLTVTEVDRDQALLPGHAYVAPGDRHLCVVRAGAGWCARLEDGPPVSGHRPSVDVLFDSVARHAGPSAAAALLTGMGVDGARGLLAIRRAGGTTMVQDRASSVVWGMPGSAVALDAADHVLPLDAIPARLLDATPGMGQRARQTLASQEMGHGS